MFECKFKATSTSWYRNGRRRSLSDAAERLWHALKDCSDSFGLIEGDEDEILYALFAGIDGWDVEKVRGALVELDAAGLIAAYSGRDGEPMIEIARHDEHQLRELIRKRGDRRKHPERARTGANSRSLTPLSGLDRIGPSRKRYEDEDDRKGTESAPADPGPRATPPDAREPADAGRSPMSDVREVFEHWKALFGKRSDTKLDEPRTRRIRWAIKTYGVAKAKRSLEGYAADDWDGRAKHHDLKLLFRDAEHVERGLDLADRRDNGDDLSQYDRPINGNGGAAALIPNPLDDPLPF